MSSTLDSPPTRLCDPKTVGGWISLVALVGVLAVALSSVPVAVAMAPTHSSASPGVAPRMMVRAIPTVRSAPEYDLNFTETGLPAGTSWYVNLTAPVKATSTSTTSVVTFVVPNGTYYFSLDSPIAAGTTIPLYGATEQYLGTTTNEPVTVNGENKNYPFPIVYTLQYLLLPLTLATTEGTVSGGGYYDAGAVATIAAGSDPGYTFSGWTGICESICTGAYTGPDRIATVTMNGPILEYASFSQLTYGVTFQAVGLAPGTTWSVTFNGSTSTSAASSIGFTSPNGTFNFSVGTPVSGTTGVRYVAIQNVSGVILIQGEPVTEIVGFGEQFQVSASVAGARGGSVTPLSGWYDAGASVTFNATAAAGYAFVGWTGNGTASYSGTLDPVTITASSPVIEIATFAPTYALVVTETGLPKGTSWSVTLRSEENSSGTNLSFALPNGTYSYTVGYVAGYRPAAEKGKVTVDGGTANLTLAFEPVTYEVLFEGTGSSANWSVTTDGITNWSNATDSVTFFLANSSQPVAWNVSPPSGYSAEPSSGTFTVKNASVVVALKFKSLPPSGLLGIGTTLSYVVLGLGVAAAIAVLVIWIAVLQSADRPKGTPPPKMEEEEASPPKEEEKSEEPAPEESPSDAPASEPAEKSPADD